MQADDSQWVMAGKNYANTRHSGLRGRQAHLQQTALDVNTGAIAWRAYSTGHPLQ